MDRQIVYPGQILPETTLLQSTKDAMISVAKLSAAVLGTSNIANGFAVSPTGPASLQVVCAPGEIYSLTAVDALAFSTLPADTTHSIMKQGIMLDGVTLSCPAPGTTGQSINYLIQATYQDTDSTPVLLPYYNSANPALPYSGMGNNGLTQNTSRKGSAIVAVKAGASATTGSQSTPAPDAGYVGLYVVSVASGQTTITSSSISQYSAAPLLPSGILHCMQNGTTSYALGAGAVNIYGATFTPAITSLEDGMVLRFKASIANTGASTFTPSSGISSSPIVGGAHAALQGGEIAVNGDVWVQWNSSIGAGSWVMVDSTGGAVQVPPATAANHAMQLQQATGRLLGTPQVFTASGTYTPTAGMVSCIIEVQGGGAAAGGATVPSTGNISVGSPGTSGAYGRGRFLATAVGSSQVVTVGAGGTGVSGAAGTAGGSSSVGSLISAPGGVAGSVLNNQVPPQSNANGSTTAQPTGANISGNSGTCSGISYAQSAGYGYGGYGGGSNFGGGLSITPINSGGGGIPNNYGCGGSGVCAGSGSAILTGGGGKGGIVIIWEYA